MAELSLICANIGKEIILTQMFNQGSSAVTRWAKKAAEIRIALSPALPDRSLVVKAEIPLYLKREEKTKVFIRIPVWVQLKDVDNDNIILADLPTLRLSNTWFGDLFWRSNA